MHLFVELLVGVRLRISNDKTLSDYQTLRQEHRQLKQHAAEKDDLQDQVEK